MKPTKRQIAIAEHFVKKVLNEGSQIRFPETIAEFKKVQRTLYQNINNNDPQFNYTKLNRFFERFYIDLNQLTKDVDKIGPDI